MASENTWDTEEGQNGGNKDDGTIHWERLWIQDDDKEELEDGFLRIVTTFSFTFFTSFLFFFFFGENSLSLWILLDFSEELHGMWKKMHIMFWKLIYVDCIIILFVYIRAIFFILCVPQLVKFLRGIDSFFSSSYPKQLDTIVVLHNCVELQNYRSERKNIEIIENKKNNFKWVP